VNRSYAGVPEVPLGWFFEHRRDVRIVDVREPAELRASSGILKGQSCCRSESSAARWWRGMPAWPPSSSADRALVRRRSLILEAAGFGKIGNLAGGMIAWRSAGYPVVNRSPVMTPSVMKSRGVRARLDFSTCFPEGRRR
jgi:rhodanese-related sulfurtransferase